jgi:hypothetical protein
MRQRHHCRLGAIAETPAAVGGIPDRSPSWGIPSGRSASGRLTSQCIPGRHPSDRRAGRTWLQTRCDRVGPPTQGCDEKSAARDVLLRMALVSFYAAGGTLAQAQAMCEAVDRAIRLAMPARPVPTD